MQTAIIIVFLLGYACIVFEENIKINKAASAMILGVGVWSLISINDHNAHHVVKEQLSEIAGILFFLLSAMTIVELIDAHDGFDLISNQIKGRSASKLLVIIAVLAFFLSALLDNLTTAIVMTSLVKKLISDTKIRLYFAGMIVIAANAGGAWSPIGDVTTTMLWIGGQISPFTTISTLFIPSLLSAVLPLFIMSKKLAGVQLDQSQNQAKTVNKEGKVILFTGLAILVFVPIFKNLTGLPPFMAILLGLGLLWVVSELVHFDKAEEDKEFLTVIYALRKIDTPSILFFLGILLAIGALQHQGVLSTLATYLENTLGHPTAIVGSIGLASAIVDNVPLVAAAQGMYTYALDHPFWQLLAFASGTGGSILIIGSAAGVAIMGLEKISFTWYLKNISPWALIGYLSGLLLLHFTV